jgi:hypothetical protein
VAGSLTLQLHPNLTVAQGGVDAVYDLGEGGERGAHFAYQRHAGQLCRRQMADKMPAGDLGDLGRSSQPIIVVNDHAVIGRQVDVELDPVGARVECREEPGDRVLGIARTGSQAPHPHVPDDADVARRRLALGRSIGGFRGQATQPTTAPLAFLEL